MAKYKLTGDWSVVVEAEDEAELYYSFVHDRLEAFQTLNAIILAVNEVTDEEAE